MRSFGPLARIASSKQEAGRRDFYGFSRNLLAGRSFHMALRVLGGTCRRLSNPEVDGICPGYTYKGHFGVLSKITFYLLQDGCTLMKEFRHGQSPAHPQPKLTPSLEFSSSYSWLPGLVTSPLHTSQVGCAEYDPAPSSQPTWTFQCSSFFGNYIRYPSPKENTNPNMSYLGSSRYMAQDSVSRLPLRRRNSEIPGLWIDCTAT